VLAVCLFGVAFVGGDHGAGVATVAFGADHRVVVLDRRKKLQINPPLHARPTWRWDLPRLSPTSVAGNHKINGGVEASHLPSYSLGVRRVA
jgi:hypothetical protein